MIYFLIGILIILVVVAIVLILQISKKSNDEVIKDEDILKLKLSFSDEFNRLNDKLDVNNEKITLSLIHILF